MPQRFSSTLNAFTALLLGLTGVSFLLIPTHQQALLNDIQLSAAYILGGVFYLGALACAMTIVIPTSRRQSQIVRITSIVMLGVLFTLYVRAGFLVEAALPFFAIVAHCVLFASELRGAAIQYRLLRIFVVAINIVGAGILFLDNIPRHIAYGNLGGSQAWLIALFLAMGVITILSFNEKIRYSRLLPMLSAIPWLAWCAIYFRASSAPSLIPPIAFIGIILFGNILPWNRLVLPQGDIIGLRVTLVVSLVHAITLAFIAGLLLILDQALNITYVDAASSPLREFSFYLMVAVSGLIIYGVINVVVTINGLAKLNSLNEDMSSPDWDFGLISWNQRVARYIRPFSLTHENLQNRLDLQSDQISILSRKLAQEKKRNAQLTLLSELSQQLEAQLDQPVAAQLAVNALERAVECDLVCLYLHEPELREFVALASAGRKTNIIPPGYRQGVTRGVLGRATRQRKTQIVQDTRNDPDYLSFENDRSLSALVVPVIFNGYIHGLIELNDEKIDAFSATDIALAEMISAELARSWERSNYYERLTDLIETGVSLSSMVDPQAAVQEIAAITRQILRARFTYVKIQPGKDDAYAHTGYSGFAPKLADSLETESRAKSAFLKTAINALQPFRIRDTRKYGATSSLHIDYSNLRSLLVIPVRLHRLSIGTILAFGKQGEVFFTENDESLARLLSIQAAGAFESTWLQQELRSSLNTTSLLYQLSIHVIQAEELREAGLYIAQTAQKLAKGSATGIVLFTTDGKIEAEVEVGETGPHGGASHPTEMIDQVMRTGEALYKSPDQFRTQICLPIQTSLRRYGVLWFNIPENRGANTSNPADLQTLTNQAALALERSRLLVEWRHQAEELKIAYMELELAYDRTLAALMSSLDARDRETEGHSLRVSQIAVELGREFGLSTNQLKALKRGALLHDIGKIGVSDTILHKPGPLSESEWKAMRLHPDIGARIVDEIPFLQETIPVIRYHQERWDGSGYPLGLSGKEIPLLARIFAAVDAFDALTSNRPYRTMITMEEAMQYIREQAGILFDPEIVQVLDRLFAEGRLDEVQVME